MASYFMNEATFELPDVASRDQTAHVIDLLEPGREPVAIITARGGPADRTGVEELAARRVADERARLLGYSVVSSGPSTLGGEEAFQIVSRWRHDGRIFTQSQVHAVFAGEWLYVSVSGPASESDRIEAAFRRVSDTFVWRR